MLQEFIKYRHRQKDMQDRLYDTDRVMAPIPANHLKTKIISADGKAEVSRSRHDQITAKIHRENTRYRKVGLYLLQTHTLSSVFWMSSFLYVCLCVYFSLFFLFFCKCSCLSHYLFLCPPLLCLPASLALSPIIYSSLFVYASISVSHCASLTVSLCLSFSSQIHINALFPPFLYFLFLLCFVFIYYSFIFILNVCKY